jgi:hypothetical protein
LPAALEGRRSCRSPRRDVIELVQLCDWRTGRGSWRPAVCRDRCGSRWSLLRVARVPSHDAIETNAHVGPSSGGERGPLKGSMGGWAGAATSRSPCR